MKFMGAKKRLDNIEELNMLVSLAVEIATYMTKISPKRETLTCKMTAPQNNSTLSTFILSVTVNENKGAGSCLVKPNCAQNALFALKNVFY